MALHAHIIIAARSAAFGQPEIRLNMMPGGGATQREVAPDDAWMQRALDMAVQKEGVQAFLGRGKPGGVAPRQLANGGGRAATTHP